MTLYCTHEGGDYFDGMWICADCYKKMSERPKRYDLGFLDGTPRQDIVWEASIATCDGVAFGKFLMWMVSYLRLMSLWTISKDEARNLCLDVLSQMGEPYGSKYAGWEKSDAKELVREGIIAYWDEGPSGSNK